MDENIVMKKNKHNNERITYETRVRERYHHVILGIFICSLLSIVLAVGLAYMTIIQQKPKYYATTTSGDLIPLQTLSEPVISDNYLAEWAALTIRSMFNLDFVQLEQNLNNSRKYFTSNGFKAFIDALRESKLIEVIQEKKLTTSAVITQTPSILSKSIVAGQYSWVLQMPVLVTYTSANQTIKRGLVATMMIRREPVLGASQGIQITDIVLQPQMAGASVQEVNI
jgi:intracellular multiplication protein IcmL